MVDALTKGYATDAAIKQRLDTGVIYVVPRVNADGAELMFAPVKALRRTNATPFDADNDGRIDEDGPEDLNKDGVITLMRVKDPKGPYMVSPDDPRLMKRADPAKGESGGWALYWEGLDKDNDGFIAEDGPGGVDINRNFMHQYPYYEPDAGRYMVSEAETRAMLEFMLKHRNIAAIADVRRERQPDRDAVAARRPCRRQSDQPDRLRRPDAGRRAPGRDVPGRGRRTWRPRRRRDVHHDGRGRAAGRTRRRGGARLPAAGRGLPRSARTPRLRRPTTSTSASSARSTAS